jgi:hypothetical protein
LIEARILVLLELLQELRPDRDPAMFDVVKKRRVALLECSFHDRYRSDAAVEVPQDLSLPFESAAVGIMTNGRADVLRLCLPND